ncbi:MAG: hypothetical protein GX851_08490, partial [Clostridiales bacterium]|nr:hypothetical protein [Clostridiales bacterium]
MFSGGFSELFSREPDAAAEISGCAQSLHVKGEASFRSWAQGFVLRLEAVNLPQIKSGMYLPVIEPHGAETRIFLPAVT